MSLVSATSIDVFKWRQKMAERRRRRAADCAVYATTSVRYFSVAACVCGFLFIVRGQLSKFVDGFTSVATTYRPTEAQKVDRQLLPIFFNQHRQLCSFHPKKLPNLVFCLDDPFLANATFSSVLVGDGGNLVRSPDVESGGINENEFAPNRDADVRWTEVDTVYNGRCRMAEVREDMGQGRYIMFKVRKGQGPVTVFFLQPGMEFSVCLKKNCNYNSFPYFQGRRSS